MVGGLDAESGFCLFSFGYQESATPSGLLPREGEEVGGVGKSSLHMEHGDSFTHSCSDPSVIQRPIFPPPSKYHQPTLQPLTSSLMEKGTWSGGRFLCFCPNLPPLPFPFVPVLDEAASPAPAPAILVQPFTLPCATNPPEDSQRSRFTWHEKRQDLKT